MKKVVFLACAWLVLLSATAGAAQRLATLEFKVVGSTLSVTPEVLAVPKGIAGSVGISLAGVTDPNDPLLLGTHIEALLRGPGFEAMRLVGKVNEPLMLPPLSLVGDYRLDQIRLVDAQGNTKMEATPSSVPVNVFDEVLVSKVVSRPLTMEEIKEKGITIDEQNFRAIEFEVGFVLDGKTIPVRFPVIAPTFHESTEIIPQAELEAKLLEAAFLNQQLAGEAQLPPELEQSGLNIQIQGINFQRVEANEGDDLALQIPPIPALMVIPGNIGFLNQFFSVQIFTENAAPGNSGLSVVNVEAKLVLPAGPDRIPSPENSLPGDDPLRFARVDGQVQAVQKVVRPGPDSKIGTSDDIPRLRPGETGQGEFLVEGLQEGLHVMDLELTADLEGLAAGIVKVKGRAAGSVLVRNPKFSMAFSHPRTVRAGEPYEASVTILNTSSTVANEVSITLPSTAISGAVLESSQTVALGGIKPGETKTATFRLRAQRTGAITFSNLSTSDDRLVGRFRLRMGVDERGVALSPDTIGMPDYVNDLPTNIVIAATRVLGQALSIATAGQLPPGVRSVPKSIVTRRVLELAEAGQRIRYGDPVERVLPDLLLDWQGGREGNGGFDEILRITDAGREWREAIFGEIERADDLNAGERLATAARDLAGRAEQWSIASASAAGVQIRLLRGTNIVSAENSLLSEALVYQGDRGAWLVFRPASEGMVEWHNAEAVENLTLRLLRLDTNGAGVSLVWNVPSASAGTCFTHALSEATRLSIDAGCDGLADAELNAESSILNEKPPELVSVFQDRVVRAGRPFPGCLPAPSENYGTVLAVLFSKPMVQSTINVPSAYMLDNGNTANSVQIQPGGRVALLNMRLPVGAIRPRAMTVTGVTDARGNTIAELSRPVQTDLGEGVAIKGRVVRADGSPAGSIPVTLTMYDQQLTGFADCLPFIVRVSQVFTDANGFFDFDFVLAGIPYSVSATDTGNLTPEGVQLILEASSGDTFNRQKLLELANSPSVQGTLLAEFAVGAMPEAIAKAEGLDRALIRDLVEIDSPRTGSETPIALRFRGRGTVTGTVVAADGTSRVPQAVVNLFPDPDSRELGRGIRTDENGRFAFFGVPLGIFSLQVTSAAGQMRTVSDVIEQAGTTKDMQIVLSTNRIVRTELKGRVLETDNISPHANAQVIVGRFREGKFVDVVAFVRADEGGFWVANVPSGTYDLVAISFDGKRRGERRDILAAQGASTQVTLVLQGRANVIGRVENSVGNPVPNALVAGGETIVRTDENGLFTLPGVPTGLKTISAGLERNLAAGIKFPRLGSATVNVLPGIDNFAVIRLRPAGSISGRVLDVRGQPVPNVGVAIPQENGFLWVTTDGEGKYLFENLGLGDYTLSAPAPVVAETDTSGLLQTIRGGSEEEILAAIGEAFAIFTGASDPFLNGEGPRFNPLTWGFTKATIRFDDDNPVANIIYLAEGTVSGTVLNPQGVPIGARVRLTGVGPLPNGAPSFIIRGEANSDPALGTFSFPKQLLAGSWGLQAASPFFPVVITASGQTTSVDPDATNIVLQFPPDQDNKGRIIGQVFYPDGTPVNNQVAVHISLSHDYIIQTDTNGFFDTVQKLQAQTYSVEVDDPVTGLKGATWVQVKGGQTNVANVRLLGKGSLTVNVRLADGTPAAGANVRVNQGGFPNDQAFGPANENGQIRFENIFEGSYGVQASKVVGPVTIQGRNGAVVQTGQHSAVTVFLAPTAGIKGLFVKRDRTTPVPFAQVAIGSIGFATTDEDGEFEVEGIPLGTYRLVTQDPVSGIAAVAQVTLSVTDEVREVVLVEQSRGEIQGTVINSYANGFVPGATVTLRVNDGITPARSVTAGPDGRFSFPGSPAGTFDITAEDPITKLTGHRSGTLAENVPSITVEVPLQALGNFEVQVFEPGGATPDSRAVVSISGPKQLNSDTDPEGKVRFTDLPLGTYRIRAFSLVLGQTRSGGEIFATISTAGQSIQASVTLGGVGSVSGQVFRSDGEIIAPGSEVTVHILAPLSPGQVETALANSEGRFTISNIPVGAYRVTAQSEALAASINDVISANGEADEHRIILGASGSVRGVLLRADGTTPAAGVDLLLTFNSQSGLPGRAVVVSSATGEFVFQNVPAGPFELSAVAPQFAGVLKGSGAIANNGEEVDLGDLALDEDDPAVVSVTPAPTSIGVPTTTTVDLYFNEELSAPSIQQNGIYLRLGTNIVEAALELLPDPTNGVPRLVRLTPNARLLSERTYEVVVVNGERRNALGAVVGTGPTDLVDRFTITPFVSSFTTADNDPPLLLAMFPTNGAVQIDVRSVVRFTFNEPVRLDGAQFSLEGPQGAVTGEFALTLNDQAMTFVPAAALEPNRTYSFNLAGVKDLAGNEMPEAITGTFNTLDTQGPVIAAMTIADGKQPLASTRVNVEATLAAAEPGVTVRFTQDLNPIGSSSAPPFSSAITLPATGSTTIRAVATDQFGNDGPLKELVISVVSNQPPQIQFTRVSPVSGPVPSGVFVSVDVTATDDSQVTNLRAIASGALRSELQGTNSTRLRIQGIVPANAGPSQKILIIAEAKDDTGQSSGEQVLEIAVSDATRPTIAVLAPAENAIVSLAGPLALEVQARDNSDSVKLDVDITGGITASATATINVQPNAATVHTFNIPLVNPPLEGVTFTVGVQATDAAGNSSTVTRRLRLPDQVAPTLISILPADAAEAVSVNPEITITFSEAVEGLDGALEVVGGEEVIPGQVEFDEEANIAVWRAEHGLAFNTSYQVRINQGATDPSGNPLEESVSAFTTTSFGLTQPGADADVVETAPLTARAGGENSAGIFRFHYDLGGFAQTLALPPAFEGLVTVPSIAEAGGTSVVLSASAVLSNDTANLLINGGNDLALVEGVIPAWISAGEAGWSARTGSPEPHSAQAYFAPSGGTVEELFQEVDISGKAVQIDSGRMFYQLEARLRSGADGDQARVLLEFRAGELVLHSAELNNQGQGGSWQPFASLIRAPAGARQIRIRMAPVRVAGDTTEAYYDSLTLRAYPAVEVVPVTLRLHPVDVDSDSDGLTNGLEIVIGSNPFVPDGEADSDGDGLSNAQELALGTHPGKADTDEDGLSDPAETSLGTNPLLADTDGDGVVDGEDTDPLNAGVAPTLLAPNLIQTVEGVATNLTVIARDGNGNLVQLEATSSLQFQGLKAEFFNHGTSISALSQVDWTAVPAHSQTITMIDFRGEPFYANGLMDQFATRITGRIDIPTDGEYRFYTVSDDGSRLWIDGQQVVNNDFLQSPTERSGVIFLNRGAHDFEVRFYENGGGAFLQALWQGPGFNKQLIPASVFQDLPVRWSNGSTVMNLQSIGGFTTDRGGDAALVGGSFAASLFGSLRTHFPLMEIQGASTLSLEFFQKQRLVILSSLFNGSRVISPLTADEQNALGQFVMEGGAAVLLLDNSSLGGGADAAHESFINPFGMDISGVISSLIPATVLEPEHPVANGPFGQVTNYNVLWPGWLDLVHSNAVVLARIDQNSQPTLVYLPAAALAPSSGPVLVSTEHGLPEPFILNFVKHAGFSDKVREQATELLIDPLPAGTSTIRIIALDADSLSVTQEVTVVTLPDLDRDLIPDAEDSDMDGDFLDNEAEIAAGTDPRNADSDQDTIPDGLDNPPLGPTLPPVAGEAFAGGSMEFDGLNDYIYAGHGNLAPRDALTVSAWFESTDDFSVDQSGNYLISKGPFNSAPWQDFAMIYSSDRTLTFVLVNESTTQFVVTSRPLSEGIHHAAATYDSVRQRLRLYVDGTLESEVQASGRIRASNNHFYIGDWNGNSTWHFWHGKIDEVQIWNRALTHADVRGAMLRRPQPDEPGLVAYFPLDETAGSRAFSHTASQFVALMGQGTSAKSPVFGPGLVSVYKSPLFVTPQASQLMVVLPGASHNENTPTATVTMLPVNGALFAVDSEGNKAEPIVAVPFEIGESRRVVYEPNSTYRGEDHILYTVSNGAETSTAIPAVIRVSPVNQNPIALPDELVGFENTPLILNLLANDVDPDANPIRVGGFTQPANGTLRRNIDGTLTYEPNPGFSGTDTFTYSVVDSVVWRRFEDWTPGTGHNTTLGNPDRDRFGFATWQYEFLSGGALNSENPWHAQQPQLLTWDQNWFGGSGLWARGDDVSPPVSESGLTHVGEIWDFIPAASWVAPFDMQIDIAGTLQASWSGINGVGSPMPLDIAIVKVDGSGNSTVLFSETVQKPTNADNVGESVRLDVALEAVPVSRADKVLISLRAQASRSSRWFGLADDLFITAHSPSNSAVVTIDVGQNTAPETTIGSNGSALFFDGSNDYVNLGNPPQLQITGNQTIEFWINLATYNGRQNPVAKAYGGEGTMTIETDGSINYFYGNTGANSGASVQNYQGVTTSKPLQLNTWTHVALVRNLDTLKIHWYLDGQPAGEADALFPAAVAGGNPFTIAAGYVNHLHGTMDEVRVWNIARTQAEIQEGMFARMEGEKPGLVGYWNLDEGQGTVATDQSSSSLNGTLGGGEASRVPLWVPSAAPFENSLILLEDTPLVVTLDGIDADNDPLQALLLGFDKGSWWQTADGIVPLAPVTSGKALQFDSSNDLVTLPETPSNDLISRPQWSITAWIRPNSFNRAWPTIYSEGHWRASFGVRGDNHRLDSWFNNGQEVQSSVPVPLDTWSHVALVFTGTERRLYLNGQLVGSRSDSPPTNDGGGAAIGAIPGDPNNSRSHFHGGIDDLALWQVALSAERINDIINSSDLATEPGLLSLWRFEEGAGLTAMDEGPAGVDGSLGGGDANRAPAWFDSAAPLHGGLAVSDSLRRLIYIPPTNYFGTAVFNYRVNDGKVFSPPATVHLRIQSVNDAPVANPETNYTIGGFGFTTVNVLLNDTDVEAQPLTVLDFTQPLNGTVVANGPGTFRYDPAPGFVGTDSFTYRATDGISNSLPATVTIIVEEPGHFRWINPAGGAWNVASNWSQNQVPGAADSAVIDLPGDYTITMNVPATVRRVVFSAPEGTQRFVIEREFAHQEESFFDTNVVVELRADLTGSGLLRIAGALEWHSGHLWSGGNVEIEPTGTALLTSGGDRIIVDGRRMVNRGVMILSSTRLLLDNRNSSGATLENRGTLQLNGTGRVTWNNWSSSRPVFFQNFGTIVKAGTENGGIEVDYTGDGLIDLQGGTLNIQQAFNLGGRFHTAPGTTMLVNGRFNILAGSEFEPLGAVLLQSGGGTWGSSFSVPDLTIQGGNWETIANLQTERVTFNGGEVNGSGQFVVLESLQWNGGAFVGSGKTVLANSATAFFTNSGDRYLTDAREMINEGTIQFSAGRLLLDNRTVSGATFRNRGAMNISGSTAILWNNWSGARPVFVFNEGVITRAGEGTVTEVSILLDNSGTIELESGMFRMNAGLTHSGEFDISSGAVLAFNGGVVSFGEGAVATGEGLVSLLQGSGAFQSTLQTSGRYTISGGAWSFNAPQPMSELAITGGKLAGTGTVTVTNTLTWSGGEMDDAGTTLLVEGAVLTATGAGDKYVKNGRKLVLEGESIFQAGRVLLDNNSTAGATLENRGRMEAWNEFDILWNNWSSTRPVALVNKGTWIKKEGAGTTSVSVPLVNEGLIHVQEGVLVTSSGGSSSGVLQVEAGAQAIYEGGNYSSSAEATLAGDGLVTLAQGTGEFLHFSAQTGLLAVRAGTWRFNTNQVFPFVEISGGELNGTGDLTISSNLTWTGGTMRDSGKTIIAEGATATVSGAAQKMISNARHFINRSIMTISNGHIALDNLSLAGAALKNEGNLTFEDEADVIWNNWSSSRPVSMSNSGRLIKQGAGTTTELNIPFESSGVLEIQDGTIRLRESSTHTGAVWKIASGGTLHLAERSHSVESVLTEGAGNLLLDAALTLLSDLNLGALNARFNSTLSGAFTISNTTGGMITFARAINHAGGMVIAGTLEQTGNHTSTIAGVLTLEASGKIINPGTLRVGNFVNNGGVVEQNPPVLIALPPPLQIESISLGAGGQVQALNAGGQTVVLQWRGVEAGTVCVQVSADLKTWRMCEAMITTAPGGISRAAIDLADGQPQFYRLQYCPWK